MFQFSHKSFTVMLYCGKDCVLVQTVNTAYDTSVWLGQYELDWNCIETGWDDVWMTILDEVTWYRGEVENM